VFEAIGFNTLASLLEGSGFEITVETSSRRAMNKIKTWQPDVLLADFNKRYFHDRVSNLESLLALATRNPATRIVIIYDTFHAADMELLKQRHRIDAALTLPITANAFYCALEIDQGSESLP
jgi:CheY-like chemotaxis protein